MFEASEADAAPFASLDPVSRDHHAELVAMDRSIGTLRNGLRELNLADSTLVWVKSDNGGLPNIDYDREYLGVHPDTTGHLRGFKILLRASLNCTTQKTDPSEEENIILLQPGIAECMREQLEAWSQSVNQSITGADYPEGKVLRRDR